LIQERAQRTEELECLRRRGEKEAEEVRNPGC